MNSCLYTQLPVNIHLILTVRFQYSTVIEGLENLTLVQSEEIVSFNRTYPLCVIIYVWDFSYIVQIRPVLK